MSAHQTSASQCVRVAHVWKCRRALSVVGYKAGLCFAGDPDLFPDSDFPEADFIAPDVDCRDTYHDQTMLPPR